MKITLKIIIALILCVLLIPFNGILAQTINPNWKVQVLGQSSGWVNSLAVDSNGNPHICYVDCPYYHNREDVLKVDDLKYIVWSGSNWNIQTIDKGVGKPSLVLDSQGNPYVAYIDYLGNLKYAFSDGVTWNIKNVVNQSSEGSFPSLALDPQGNPHISYCQKNGDLIYAYWNCSAFNVQTVCQTGYGNESTDEAFYRSLHAVDGYNSFYKFIRPSLALDSAGNPHISYFNVKVISVTLGTETVYAHEYELMYASFDGANWNFQKINAKGVLTSSNYLAVDSYDKPHICFISNNESDIEILNYASLNGADWIIQQIEQEFDQYHSYLSDYTSLGLDSKGNPHISYIANIYQGSMEWKPYLRYTYWTGSKWIIQTIEQIGNYSRRGFDLTSISLNSREDFYISYVDTFGNLKLAQNTSGGYTTMNEKFIYFGVIGTTIIAVVSIALLLLRKRIQEANKAGL
jgi:hypothetical protein